MPTVRATRHLPRVVTRGSPHERGRQYGRQAADRVRLSISRYREVFSRRCGLDWTDAVARAGLYEAAIAEFSPSCLEEMRGISEGADVDFGSILAINARSELMFAGGGAATGPCECTSFAILPEAFEADHTIIGQNWDWLPFAEETVVLVECHRDDGPDFMTVVEAGLLAKVGINSAGLGVCTNTLVSTRDGGRVGVPYHVMLRGLLDDETITAASRRIMTADRAFSANYLIAHRDGVAANFETLPGGRTGVKIALPDAGILSHTNHYLSPEFADLDARVADHPHTMFRLDTFRRGLRRGGIPVSLSQVQEVLRNHQNRPDAVCSHPDERQHPLEQRATVSSVIANLSTGEFYTTYGQPCMNEYEKSVLSALPTAGLAPVEAA